MDMMGMRTSLKRQTGVGLIEVLIAILVIAVGVLGNITMQLSAKRVGQEAVQRSLASGLAQDLLERMRANPSALSDYAGSWKYGVTIASAGTDCGADSASCTGTQMAAYDLNQWLNLVNGASATRTISGTATAIGGLVNPTICITNSTGYVTVAIAWRGYQQIADPGVSSCGDDSAGFYDGDTAGDNKLRQVMSISTYIKGS